MPGVPGGAVVEGLPANAGNADSSPGLGGSHVLRSGWACEPRLLSLRVWSLCSAAGEAAMVRGLRTAMRSGPRLLQLGKALARKRRPNIAINQSINQSFKKKCDATNIKIIEILTFLIHTKSSKFNVILTAHPIQTLPISVPQVGADRTAEGYSTVQGAGLDGGRLGWRERLTPDHEWP